MAKAAYVGVGDVARKVKKMYVGVDGVARKVKKGYIGVNGVARLFFSGDAEPPVYNGTADPLQHSVTHVAAASNNNYALFVGGLTISSGAGEYYGAATAYSLDLVRIYAPDDYGYYDQTGVSFGNYALFHGGRGFRTSGATGISSAIASYNTSLTRSMVTPSSGSSFHMAFLSGGAVATNNAIFFAGSARDDYDDVCMRITCVTPSLTRTEAILDTTIHGKMDPIGASIGGRALFYGGRPDQEISTPHRINYSYDDSLTRVNVYGNTIGETNRTAFAGTSIADYAMFAGGDTSFAGDFNNAHMYYGTGECFTTSLTVLTTRIELSHVTIGHAATSINEQFALFGGGTRYEVNENGMPITGAEVNDTVDIFDSSLTRLQHAGALSIARTGLAATSIGDHALFGGGTAYYSTNAVDIFSIA